MTEENAIVCDSCSVLSCNVSESDENTLPGIVRLRNLLTIEMLNRRIKANGMTNVKQLSMINKTFKNGSFSSSMHWPRRNFE